MSSLSRKIEAPKNHIIEKTALELAATYYEIGREQGLTSKYKDARSYARAMFPKFIPKTIDILLDMLHNPHTADLMKQEIWEALQERVNDDRMQPLNGSGGKIVENFKPSRFDPVGNIPSVQQPVIMNQTKPEGLKANPFKKVN